MPDLPYYTLKKTGIRSLDGSGFFLRSLRTRSRTVAPITPKPFARTTPDGLRAYLLELYTPPPEKDIRFILSNRTPQRIQHPVSAEFYAGAIVTYMANRLCDPAEHDILSDIDPFGNIVHDSIEHMIKVNSNSAAFSKRPPCSGVTCHPAE